MDKESRLQRARDMGFDTDTVWYHGTNKSFDSFETNTAMGWGDGVYFTDNPAAAEEFGSRVIPVYLKKDIRIYNDENIDPAVMDESKTWQKYKDKYESPEDAWSEDGSFANDLIRELGYDGIKSEGSNGIDGFEVVMFDPKNIRSVDAAFDPSESGSSNIMFSANPEPEPFLEENRRLREEDQTLWDKAKKMAKRQLAPGGLLPTTAFDAMIERDNELQVVEFDAKHLIGELDRAIEKDYGRNLRHLSENDRRAISNALAGTVPESMKPATKQAIYAMRQKLDIQSKQYIKILQAEADLMSEGFDEAELILLDAFLAAGDIFAETDTPAGKGAATKSRNAVMDEAKAQAKEIWGDGKKMQSALSKVADVAERISMISTITGNLGTYVHRSYQVFDDPKWFKKIPNDVLNAAREYVADGLLVRDADLTEKQALQRADVILDDLLKNGTAYEDFAGFIKESKLGAKDLSVLKKRKDIAPEIRALLGEYSDPRLNFAKSTTKMGRLIWNQTFLNHIREVGMGYFLFTEDDRPIGTTKIAAEGSEVYAPLNGLYTYRDVNQAFKDALGKNDMAGWLRTIVKMNGLVKFGKTVLSPTTAARNWQSAFFFTIANGHFDLSHTRKSVSGLREYFLNNGESAKIDYLRKLKQLGVVYDTPYAGEMMRLLDDSKIENFLMGHKYAESGKEMLGLVQKFYQYGDDFWKIIGFENEKQNFIKAGFSESEAETEAAKRIRNTYPTYSMVGRGVQFLRMFPLAGTFVSFPAEIVRTSYHILRYAAQDVKDPRTRSMGMKRIAGIVIASAFAKAAQEATKYMFDIDDDDEEAVRLQAAPWNKNSNLMFTGRDEDGNIRYVDLSFIDPYNYWKRPINAIMRDQPWEDAAVDASAEMLTPFFGTDIAAGTIFEVVSNKKLGSGGQVYKENDMPLGQLQDIADHLRKSLQPGIISNLERTYKAIEGETSPSGRKYNLTDEGLAWVGWRVSTLDPKTALYYRLYDWQDGKREATRMLSEVLHSPNSVSDDDIKDAYELSNRVRNNAYEEMYKIIGASRKSGMTDGQIRNVLVAGNVGKRDIASLLSGVTQPYRVSPVSRRLAIRRANSMYGREQANAIAERYNKLQQF